MIKLQCLTCEEEVKTTTIQNFINGSLGCKCNKKNLGVNDGKNLLKYVNQKM